MFLISLLDKILAPQFCIYCRELTCTYAMLCEKCLSLIKPVLSYNLSLKITNKKKYDISVYSASKYKDPVRRLITAKHGFQRYTCKQLALLIWENSSLSYIDFDYFIPVPLHWTRYAYRGYNQAHIIAQELSILSGKPVINILKRVKKTKFQAALSHKDRISNVYDAFKVINDINEYKNKKYVIVDDVMTTGSTLKAVIQSLLVLEPQFLACAVAARVLDN